MDLGSLGKQYGVGADLSASCWSLGVDHATNCKFYLQIIKEGIWRWQKKIWLAANRQFGLCIFKVSSGVRQPPLTAAQGENLLMMGVNAGGGAGAPPQTMPMQLASVASVNAAITSLQSQINQLNNANINCPN